MFNNFIGGVQNIKFDLLPFFSFEAAETIRTIFELIYFQCLQSEPHLI